MTTAASMWFASRLRYRIAPAAALGALVLIASTPGPSLSRVAAQEHAALLSSRIRGAGAAPAASAESPAPERLAERFVARIDAVTAEAVARMGTSWAPGCPVPVEDLRVLTMTHWDFEGEVRSGELMIHKRHARDIIGVFGALFRARFPIARMELANGYMGNDPPLAQRNNTVGFNCRPPVGGGPRRCCEHSYGRAVDINPDQNPYVSRTGRVEPPFGSPFVDRSLGEPGMIHPNDLVVRAFAAIGWRWGGKWAGTKDYMHFSVTGR